MKLSMAWLITLLLVLSPVGRVAAQGDPAQQPFKVVSATGNTSIQVALFKSQIIRLSTPVKRISVGNPEIGDLLIIGSRQIYIVGKSLGTTNVVLWNTKDQVIGTLNLEVTHDLENLKNKLYELLPGEVIEVHSSNGSIVLSGEVSSAAKVDTAVKLAETFLKKSKDSDDTLQGTVLNMLQVGGAQQVMLHVQVAEISHSLVKRLDLQFKTFYNGSNLKAGAVNGGAAFPDAVLQDGSRLPIFGDFDQGLIGPAVSEFAPGLGSISDKGLFASYLSGDFLFNLVIDAAKNQGLAKILAEPTLTTMTGQQASVLSGGEFPVPVAQELGRTTVEYKEFGVGMKFLPVVLDSGTISLKVNVSVSDLRTDNAIALGVPTAGSSDANQIGGAFVIPALAKRTATSTVELKSGETMGIAGIISEQLRENVEKFPGLGDLPVLGPLFRSQEFIKGQTELVVFVTPRLAAPVRPENVRLPTDYFVEPSDTEFYLMGRLEGRRQEPESDIDTSREGGGIEGQFGHDL